MKGLTLYRPWPWAMIHGKPVENRTWAPPRSAIGTEIALHAGLVWDAEGAAFIDRLLPSRPAKVCHAAGAIVGVMRLVRVIRKDDLASASDPLYASPWFFGPVGWVCPETRALATPVPCKGAMGLWDLPPDVEAAVRGQLLDGKDR